MRRANILRLTALVLLSASCRPLPPGELPTEFSSPNPPAPADILQGCTPPEATQLRAFLGLLPPWDKERPPIMLELGFALESGKTPECLQAAKRMFFELSMVYPNQKEALRATLEVGAISFFLQEPATELEYILGRYADRNARMLEVAKSASSEKAIAFLRTYGGEQAGDLVIAYTAWVRRGSPIGESQPPDLQKP